MDRPWMHRVNNSKTLRLNDCANLKVAQHQVNQDLLSYVLYQI
jgi:hypothetical protein